MFVRNILWIVLLSVLVRLSCSADTITFNQTLKDGDQLISSGDSFVLGFFTPENSPGKRYVGIWYQKIRQRTVVWVANRDSPVNGTTGIIFIDDTGNLVVQDKNTKFSVWNTSVSSVPAKSEETDLNSYYVQLQDTGNLALFHGPGNRTAVWQSFDFPTNTLLPSMKLGVNKKTGSGRVLTSWKSPDDPSTGQYAFGLELTGSPQVFMNRSWSRVWRAGPWNGLRLNGGPERDDIVIFNFSEDGEEVSMSYTLRDRSAFLIFALNESGTVNRLTWQGENRGWVSDWSAPQDKCDTYSRCGSFSNCNPYDSGSFECSCLQGFEPSSEQEWSTEDSSHGCKRNMKELCRKGEGFMRLMNMKIPDAKTAILNTTIGMKQCRDICLNNCSCTGYASSNISDGGIGCFTWYGELIDMRQFQNGGQEMFVRVSASDLANLEKISKTKHGKAAKVALIVVIVLVVSLTPLLYCLIRKMKNGKKRQRNRQNAIVESNENSAIGVYVDETGSADLSIFDLRTIQLATDNFSFANKLGQGGFGSVYKGELQDGQLVAVKRLSRTSGQGIVEFKNEVTLIARLQHRNLVRLLGCCIEQEEKMLVYEYMPNKSLDSFIFGDKNESSLDWTKRFEIILGIARGLLYLHRDSRLRIIHRDLKASNVLLDASMNPKISDFGMAKIFGGDQNEANTNRVVGTYGYMSPEYAMGGHFSVKSDVFSFGVLLLEIISGRKNKNPYREHSVNLIGDVWDFWNEGIPLEIVDPSLGESYDDRKVLRCIHIGLLCIQALPNDRPNMSEVVFMLCNETKLPRPGQPGFLLKQADNCVPPTFLVTNQSQSQSNSQSRSVNSMSITKLEGR